MKKALKAITLFMLLGAMVSLLVGCKNEGDDNVKGSGSGNDSSSDFITEPHLSIVPGNGSLICSWTETDPAADSYDVYYVQEEAAAVDEIKAGTKAKGKTSPYTISGLDNGTVYSVVITANKAGFPSINSDIMQGTPSDLPSLTAPVLTISADDGILVCTWTETDPAADRYDVYYIADVEGAASSTAAVKDGTAVNGRSSPYTITGLTNDVSYSVMVTASKEGYNSVDSAIIHGIPYRENTSGGDNDLSGDISINPASAKTGTQLTAAYSGTETIAYYQWKRNGINVGANSKLFTADTAGNYTVTVSGNKDGSNSKTSSAVSVYAWNGAAPIITSIHAAEPSAHVWAADGRLYLYPSTDIHPADGRSNMDRYHVFSTDNMVDWINHGEILRRNDLPVSTTVGNAADGKWGPQHSNAYFMSAPDAAYRTGVSGKGPYFFYFSHALGGKSGSPTWENSWTIGVAWSDKPYSGFKANVVRLKNSDGTYVYGDGKLINPCIFQDGNDYYLVTGGSQQLYVSKLNGDMVSLTEPLTPYAAMTELRYYREGPWMFTRTNNGTKKYYLMYSGNPPGGNGDELLYAAASSPYGPWSYQGSILDPVGTGSTSHGSIVEFKNKWYLFYHNARLSEGDGGLRSVCVDELFFNTDGTIAKVIQTATSVAQNGPALNTGTLNSQFGAGNYKVEIKYSEIGNGDYIKGYSFNKTYNASDTSVTVGGGAAKQTNDIPTGAIHNLHLSGAYAEFTGVSGNGGKAMLRLNYALGDGTAALKVSVNGGTAVNFNLQNTGAWNVLGYSDLSINLNSGANTIRFSGAGVNIASISIYWEM